MTLPVLMSPSKSQTTCDPEGHPHDLQGSPVAREMIARLHQLGERKLALRLRECALGSAPTRCKSPLCPSCSRRAARKARRSIERAIPDGARLAMVTLTTGASADLSTARQELVDAFGALRRRAVWIRCVAGGRGQVELARSGDGCSWNVHCHVLVRVHRVRVPVGRLRAEWSELLAEVGRVGRLHWLPIERGPGDSRRTFQPGGLLLHQAQALGVAAAGRRRSARAGVGRSRPAMGPSLRQARVNPKVRPAAIGGAS